ncbi:MAG: hypothetical protein LW824_09640, partial [Algoriphagus sp.]|nr:hypothetical protein [Algoriphagus sp.]
MGSFGVQVGADDSGLSSFSSTHHHGARTICKDYCTGSSFITFATITPDYFLPGNGVLLQREMGFKTIGALDIRNACSGFIYALSVADQFIKTGMYQKILVVGAEIQSSALDKSDEGRS